VLERFRRAGIDIDALAAQLQRDGAEAFDKSRNDLLECIASKSEALKRAS
jgi:transaldolase